MPLLVRVGLFSMTLKIAWVVWLCACLALIGWRRRGRTMPVTRSTRTASSKASAEKSPSKRRWRLRANSDAPVLQPSSTLGL